MSLENTPTLKRSLTTTHMVFYGLGVTIGAGIYVLIGQAAARGGLYAPTSFLLAGVVMAFSAASFSELSVRYPVSAGEAAYIKAGFGSNTLSTLVGLMVISAGVMSAAAVSVGCIGYIRQFIDLPPNVLIPAIVLGLAMIAAWGITESVTLAAIFALVEIGGLMIIIVAGIIDDPALPLKLPEVIPLTTDGAVWSGVAAAGLLAFFAFIGFEDMVNVAEEVKTPRTTMPIAIFLTLIISTLIYFVVATIAVFSGPVEELGASDAPLALVFERITNFPPLTLSAIAIVAGLNGIIVQMVMASRVLYGLSSQGNMPAIFSKLHPVTRTPLIATGLIAAIVLMLSVSISIEGLAEMTSRVTLAIFAFVNLALLAVKYKKIAAPEDAFVVWGWVPAVGFALCILVLLLEIL